LGIAEKELRIPKSKNEYRILALGDSYTEGVGTSYQTTWVKVLEKTLRESHLESNIKAINAGIAGSDIYFEYILFKEKLMNLKPDLVIIAINNSDVHDIIIRGGFERFKPDGTVRFRKPPRWECIYAISFIFRHIVHDILGYNWYFIQKSKINSLEQGAIESIKSAIFAFEHLSNKNGFDVMIVFHPTIWEIKSGKYLHHFDYLVKHFEITKSIVSIDLFEYYNANDIITYENVHNFYWSLDEHHNTRGYHVMGRAIAKKIIQIKLLDRI
jgi:hypothetical protein